MTKNEIFLGGIKTDEQIFELDVSQLLLELRGLSVALGVRLHRTGVFSASQQRQLLELVSKLEDLQRKMRLWQYHGQKDQLIFADWEKNI